MKKCFISMLLLLCLGSIAQAQFLVYREFFFSGQPTGSYFDGLGLRASHGVYEDAVTGGTPPVKQSLMISTAQSTATNYTLYQNRMWYDIEYLDTDAGRVGTTQAAANGQQLAKFIGWAKAAAPKLDIGLYSQVPVTDLWMSSHLAQRQAWNNLLQPLADTLEFLAPSIYLYFNEASVSYASYAGPMIQEAKRLAKGKKVFAFVAPGYHPSGDYPNQYASYTVWKNALNTIKNAGADGVFIFAGKGAMGSQPYNWSYIDTCGWWRATKDFVASLNATTTSTLPGTPSVVAPTQGSVLSTTSLTARWRKVSGATGYELQLSTSSGFTSLFLDDASLVDTLRQVSSLSGGTAYYLRVRAKNSLGWGSYSSTVQFSTSTTTTASVPAAPTVISPGAGQVISPLGWTSVWRKVGGAAKYQFQLSTSSSFASYVISDSTITDTTRGMGTLANGATYYIRVRARGTSSWGSYGSTVTFTTSSTTTSTAPATPTVISPVSGQVISPLGWTSVWRKVAGASKYQFQLSTSSSFASYLINDSTRTDTTRGMGNLAYGSTYYIRVRAKGTTLWGSYGSTIQFKTSASGALQSTVEELSPRPTTFELGQNYPNPFNPTTGVRFQVPDVSDVKLVVYDMLGREVGVLVNERKEAGVYEVSFDASRLASGVYIYRLTAGSFVQSKRMVLLK